MFLVFLEPRKVVQRIVHIPLEKKDANAIPNNQNKEVRTYSTKKETNAETSTPPIKIDPNESVTAASSIEDEKEETEVPMECDEKDNVTASGDEAAETTKPEKKTEENSAVSYLCIDNVL